MSTTRARRLDVALADAGLAESRSRAQALILAGRVRVRGETVRAADTPVHAEDRIEVVEQPRYVSRGGEKLAPALSALGVQVAGRVCADIGASTGGFTDVLLQQGATRVYAVDVGRGLIHWKLRQDSRVVLMERVNARNVTAFPEPVSLITVDVSFIGLEKVIPALGLAAPTAELVVLFKPQFQVDRGSVGKGGIVRDEAAVEAALARFRDSCVEQGYVVSGEAASELPGADGNREIFVRLARAERPPK